MLDFNLAPLKAVIRPNGPFGRSTVYRLDAENPGLLRRVPGMRDTFVHMPTLKRIENTAEPINAAGAGKAE
jgi:hypothetical protein